MTARALVMLAGIALTLLTAAVAKPEAIDALIGATPSHSYGDNQ